MLDGASHKPASLNSVSDTELRAPLDRGETPESVERLLRVGSTLSQPLTAGVVATLLSTERCSARVTALMLNEAPDDVLLTVQRLLGHGAVEPHGALGDRLTLDTLVMLTPGLRESLPTVIRELGGIGTHP